MANKHPCPNCGAGCYGAQCSDCRNGTAPTPLAPETFEANRSGDFLTIRSLSDTVRTVPEALKRAEIDTDIWAVDTQRVSFRQTANIEGSRQLVSIDIRLKRKVPERLELAVEALLARLAGKGPKYKKRTYKTYTANPCMLEFSPLDLHFGKLAWSRETGEDYDLEIAERSLSGAVRDVLQVAGHYQVERFLFPVGSDWFHIDNLKGETIHGTPQDTDGRWAKAFEVGYEACVRAIERMRKTAPVRVIWVGGNHDWSTSWYLVKTIQARFHDAPGVQVDCEPTPRQYVKYGINLLGFTHGDEEPHRALPALMATERPREWADTKHHEWHLGHLHKRRQVVHTAVDTHDGVVVRILPSLSGRDEWHTKKGYLGAGRVAEAYLWSKSMGYVGHFAVGQQSGLVQ
jgi:hypothetical protein